MTPKPSRKIIKHNQFEICLFSNITQNQFVLLCSFDLLKKVADSQGGFPKLDFEYLCQQDWPCRIAMMFYCKFSSMFFIVFFLSGTCTLDKSAVLVVPDNLGRKCVLPDTETPVKGPFFLQHSVYTVIGHVIYKKRK